MKAKSKFVSRKFVVTLVALAIIALGAPMGLPPAAIAAVGAVGAAYVGGQSYVDGKDAQAAPKYN